MKEHTTSPYSSDSTKDSQATHETPTSTRYEKRAMIGAGGMAAVWKGVRILGDGSRQEVAIKEMLYGVRRHPDAIERFCREARFCMDLNHENVVRVYDLVRHGDHYQIIMEYVDGVTLQRLVESGPQLPASVQRFIHGQIVAGLDGLHREGILHRDLSPTNVMVSRDGMVKLIDLGVAKDLAGPTTHGGCKGTLPFMSPELLRGEPINESSDIYSTVALLYYCLTGNPPVSGDTPEAILAKHEAGELAIFPALLPRDLRVVLEDLLKPRTERTFQQAAQIIRHLFRSAREDSHYLATRDEVALFVQSVMDDLASSGKGELRITEVMSQHSCKDIPAQEPDGTAGNDALDPASDAASDLDSGDDEDDEVDPSALRDILAYCFSDQTPPDVRAAALRAVLSFMSPDGSEDDLDTAKQHETCDENDEDQTPDASIATAESRQDGMLAHLAHLPDEDDDPGVDSTSGEASGESTGVTGDVATRILLELRARYPVFQSIDRDAWTELLDDVQYWLRDYLVPLPDFDNFEDGILLAVQARYPEFKGVNVDPATWKAMFREVWVELVRRIASDQEPEIASEIIDRASDELEAGPDIKLIENTKPEATPEPVVKAEPEPVIKAEPKPSEVEAKPKPSEVEAKPQATGTSKPESDSEARASVVSTQEPTPPAKDDPGTRDREPEEVKPRRWRTRALAVATLVICAAISTFVYHLEGTLPARSSPEQVLDDIDGLYRDVQGDEQ